MWRHVARGHAEHRSVIAGRASCVMLARSEAAGERCGVFVQSTTARPTVRKRRRTRSHWVQSTSRGDQVRQRQARTPESDRHNGRRLEAAAPRKSWLARTRYARRRASWPPTRSRDATVLRSAAARIASRDLGVSFPFADHVTGSVGPLGTGRATNDKQVRQSHQHRESALEEKRWVSDST